MFPHFMSNIPGLYFEQNNKISVPILYTKKDLQEWNLTPL